MELGLGPREAPAGLEGGAGVHGRGVGHRSVGCEGGHGGGNRRGPATQEGRGCDAIRKGGEDPPSYFRGNPTQMSKYFLRGNFPGRTHSPPRDDGAESFGAIGFRNDGGWRGWGRIERGKDFNTVGREGGPSTTSELGVVLGPYNNLKYNAIF